MVEFNLGNPDDEQTQVELSFNRVVCARHGEPFRDTWPSFFPAFAMALFEELAKLPIFEEVIGKRSQLVAEALDHSPICERVDGYTLLGAYIKSGLGHPDTCGGCGLFGQGTPYMTQNADGQLFRYPHLCFDCVVFNLSPTN